MTIGDITAHLRTLHETTGSALQAIDALRQHAEALQERVRELEEQLKEREKDDA